AVAHVPGDSVGSQDASPPPVVRLKLGRRRRGAWERVREDRVDDHVTRAGLEPAPERRLLDVAELERDPPAALVRRVDADLDTVDAGNLEGCPSERRARLGRETLAGPALPDPGAGLEPVAAPAGA